ncbi:UDP-N-acetylglucosamine 2-epimerase (non-hydrolyzing) [Candidatus Kaiserbacteria bacterium]|nr:UDP-N-acetylglucosamine 2-epimerase (non-hydrolyzing) [Candidatus Kaiserbacteria bacterium]
MKRKKLISLVFGTRPEAIKIAPIVHVLRNQDDIAFHICVTGQHREMLDQVLEIFNINPDVDLSVMKHHQNLSELTATLLTSMSDYLDTVKPDLVLAEGDTTTVFVTALSCFYKKIPFGHIEAGLRTYDLTAPWPEEGYRVLTSRLSTLHFAPTEHAQEALIKEGVSQKDIFITGNTVIDALNYALMYASTQEDVLKQILPPSIFDSTRKVVLITGHRRESFGGGLERICKAIYTLAKEFPDVDFVYPVHLNPEVQNAANSVLQVDQLPNIYLLKPLSYIPFVWIMKRSTFIITDSGGIQEEAPSLGKPILVTRAVTERPEGVRTGNAVIVGTDNEKIVSLGSQLLTDPGFYASMSEAVNPYGDGHAAEKIVSLCIDYLNRK